MTDTVEYVAAYLDPDGGGKVHPFGQINVIRDVVEAEVELLRRQDPENRWTVAWREVPVWTAVDREATS